MLLLISCSTKADERAFGLGASLYPLILRSVKETQVATAKENAMKQVLKLWFQTQRKDFRHLGASIQGSGGMWTNDTREPGTV